MLTALFELPRSPISQAQLHRLDIGGPADIRLNPSDPRVVLILLKKSLDRIGWL